MAKTEKKNRPENKEFTCTCKRLQNNFEEGQIDLYLDINVPKVKPNGEVSESNRVSKRLQALTDQLADNCDCKPIQRMRRRALGKRLNPSLLAVLLEGATIKLIGRYVYEGEKRNFEGATDKDTYTQEGWVYELVEWHKELTDEDKQEFDEIRHEEPYLMTQTAKSAAFDWYK